MRQVQYRVRLLLCHEAALDTKALLGHLLTTHVVVLLRVGLIVFLRPVLAYFEQTLFFCERPNVP